MTQFNKWFYKNYYDEVAGNPFRHNMFKAWEAGAKEKEVEMLRFAYYFACKCLEHGFPVEEDMAYDYWKKNVDKKG